MRLCSPETLCESCCSSDADFDADADADVAVTLGTGGAVSTGKSNRVIDSGSRSSKESD